MRYLLLSTLILLFSCTQKRGCLNEFASNFQRDALISCCCDYNVEEIINQVEGNHQLIETCSGSIKEYEVEVRKDPHMPETIIITNFHDRNTEIKATWNENEFKFSNDWPYENCEVEITGSVHRNGGKIHFIYAAIPKNECSDFAATTCISRAL